MASNAYERASRAPRRARRAIAAAVIAASVTVTTATAATLATAAPGGPIFEACPVDRPHRYIDDFGHARYSGGYHPHAGIDVFAPHGTPVRAPFDGRAEGSTNWAGGLTVTVHGRRGFVYNGHLSDLGKLGKVKAGEIVGFVGDSGNARGASPHNHFEWHPGGGGAANPYLLLRQSCRPKPKPKPAEPVAVPTNLRPI